MRSLLWLFPAVTLLPTVQDPTKKDTLDGSWVVTSFIAEGKEVPADKVKKMTVVFRGDLLVLNDNGQEEKYQVILDPLQKPRAIDFFEGFRSPVVVGIYELKGDVLKLCWNKPESGAKGRPGKFAASPASPYSLMILKRKEK
jgi:uncharacterized protein (TIGR03067 family)